MAVGIAKAARVFLLGAVEGGTKIQIVQIGREHTLPVVVVDLALIEHGVANAQVEYAGVAAARTAALDDGNVAPALCVGEDLHHWLVDDKTVEIPLLLQDRDNAHTRGRMRHLEQG